MNNDIREDSWFYRRTVIFGTLIFCAIMVAKLVWVGADTRFAETAVTGLLALAGSVVAGYVFGAVWDYRERLRAGGHREIRGEGREQ